LVVKPLYTYKNWKKVTTIRKLQFKHAGGEEMGLIIADKVGEIFFLNLKHLDKLAKDPESVPGRNQEDADNFDFVAKLFYGHQ